MIAGASLVVGHPLIGMRIGDRRARHRHHRRIDGGVLRVRAPQPVPAGGITAVIERVSPGAMASISP